jgi:crotonobetainyl-CoA:carnitine CoA-transferase CaiB-like acyl-CoA transferase
VLTSDSLWQRFLKVMGREDLAEDSRFLRNTDRLKNRDAMHAIIGKWFREHTVAEIDKIFGEKGIPYGLVYSAKDICEDPQNKFRGNIVEVEDPEIGPIRMQGVTPRLSETPGKITSSAPKIGQHNREIYGGLLGLTDREMQELKEEGVI